MNVLWLLPLFQWPLGKGEGEGKEQQYPEHVQSGREERSATERKLLKNNSVEF